MEPVGCMEKCLGDCKAHLWVYLWRNARKDGLEGGETHPEWGWRHFLGWESRSNKEGKENGLNISFLSASSPPYNEEAPWPQDPATKTFSPAHMIKQPWAELIQTINKIKEFQEEKMNSRSSTQHEVYERNWLSGASEIKHIPMLQTLWI